jgi:hypothetical protein
MAGYRGVAGYRGSQIGHGKITSQFIRPTDQSIQKAIKSGPLSLEEVRHLLLLHLFRSKVQKVYVNSGQVQSGLFVRLYHGWRVIGVAGYQKKLA